MMDIVSIPHVSNRTMLERYNVTTGLKTEKKNAMNDKGKNLSIEPNQMFTFAS